MKATCPECGAKYNIPDDKLTVKGLPTKCAKCNVIFRVFPSKPDAPGEEKTQTPESEVLRDVVASKEADSDSDEKELIVDDTDSSKSQEVVEDFPKSVKPVDDSKTDVKEIDDKEFDDMLEDVDFNFARRFSTKLFGAIVLVALLVGVVFFIASLGSETDKTIEANLDREAKSEANLIKRSITPEKLIALAIKTYQKGGKENISKAKALLAQALELDKENIIVKIRLAELKCQQGIASGTKNEIADEGSLEAKLLLDKNASTPLAMRAHATCLFYNNAKREAIKLTQNAISTHENDKSDDAESYLLLAIIYLDMGKTNDAFESLKASTKYDMNLFQAHHLLATLFFEKEEYRSAVLSQRSACLINPDNSTAKENLTKYERKLALLERNKTEGGSYEDHINAAIKFHKQGHINDCIKELNEALKIKPGSVTALMMKARLFVDSNPQAALAAATSAAKNGSSEAYYLMGSLQQNMGMTSAAISSYEKYLQQSPNGNKAYEVQSILSHMKGQ